MAKAATKPKENKTLSKIDEVIALMQHETGASLDEITSQTGWKPHSARAVLSGLKKKGYTITREKVDGTSRYFIAGGAGK